MTLSSLLSCAYLLAAIGLYNVNAVATSCQHKPYACRFWRDLNCGRRQVLGEAGGEGVWLVRAQPVTRRYIAREGMLQGEGTYVFDLPPRGKAVLLRLQC